MPKILDIKIEKLQTQQFIETQFLFIGFQSNFEKLIFKKILQIIV